MDTKCKKDLWDYTKEKYIIPDTAKAWALVTIREAWRSHRSELKKSYYDPYDNDEVRMSKKPGHIPECQFRELLKYWKSDKFKKMSETNTKNQKKLVDPHTAGKKSFAEKDKGTVSSKELFVVTRTRKSGRLYKASNEDTTAKIAEMEELETQMSANDGQSLDAFAAVMGPEHPGRLRLYGAGVTKTTMKEKIGNSEPILNATNDGVVQRQERMQKMEKQMEEQKRTMRQEVMADIILQLQRAGLIDPNVLAALFVPSPREATSAQAAEQGDGIDEGDESVADDLA